jgi:RNAse (barnase) inhibitor barstar
MDQQTETPPPTWQFLEDPDAFHDPAAVVVRMPRGIRSKQKLLAVLADKLNFPRYFGWNWDALHDCLTDAVNSEQVVIVHGDLPFGPHSELRRIYLAILRDLSQRTDLGEPLRVVFAVADKDAVTEATSERH